MSCVLSLLLITATVLGEDFQNKDLDVLPAGEESSEQYEFQAEVASLMDIIINSLYVNKKVFLRELISNASDAMDKVKYMTILNPDLKKGELEVKISFDSDKKTLTIRDAGIGMTKEDLVEKLGTVAKSGTTQFLEMMAQEGNVNMIGQFGVGFYSAFLAAEKVTVASKNDEDDQYVWISSAGPNFEVFKDPRGNTLERGTEVTLHLKKDAEEFSEQDTLKDVIKEYSEFIDYPIFLYMQKDEWFERPMNDEELEEEKEKQERRKQAERERKEKERKDLSEEEPEEELDEEPEEEPEEEPKMTRDKRKVWSWEKINAQKAIWNNEPKDNKIKDYVKLYQTLKRDASEPLHFIHTKGEGEVEFRAILFIPDETPSNLFENYHNKEADLRLYVRRVLISGGHKDLLPKYLNFLKGIIHSDDLPLNVSRETLQQQRIFKIISNKLVKKVIETLLNLADGKDDWAADKPNKEDFEDENDDEETKKEKDQEYQILLRWSSRSGDRKYQEFWKHYSKNIKLGVIEDASNRNKLKKLLRFNTNKSPDTLVSFEDYIENMQEGQEYIYYFAGEQVKSMKESPLIQKLDQMGYEVILLDDAIDEYVFSYIKEYDSYNLKHAARGELDLGPVSEYDEQKEKSLKELFKPLTDWWKQVLGNEVERVTLSRRLVEDPVVIRVAETGYTANMYKIAKAQAYANQKNIPQHYLPKKTLEVNPGHPSIKKMLKMHELNSEDPQLNNYAWMYYQTALINSDFNLIEDLSFSERVYNLIRKKLDVSPSEPLTEPEVQIEEGYEEDLEDIDEFESLDDLEPTSFGAYAVKAKEADTDFKSTINNYANEVMQSISEKYQKLIEYATGKPSEASKWSEYKETAEKSSEEVTGKAKEKYEEMKDSAQEAKYKSQEKYQEVKNSAEKSYERIKEELEQLNESVKQRAKETYEALKTPNNYETVKKLYQEAENQLAAASEYLERTKNSNLESIQKKAEELYYYSKETLEMAGDYLKTTAQDYKERAQEARAKGTEQLNQNLETTKEALNQVTEKLQETAQKAHEKVVGEDL